MLLPFYIHTYIHIALKSKAVIKLGLRPRQPAAKHTPYCCGKSGPRRGGTQQPYPVEQRNVVEQVGMGKGNHAQAFAELWTLVFR